MERLIFCIWEASGTHMKSMSFISCLQSPYVAFQPTSANRRANRHPYSVLSIPPISITDFKVYKFLNYKLLNLFLHLQCFFSSGYCSPPSAACANRIDIARVLSTDSSSRSAD